MAGRLVETYENSKVIMIAVFIIFLLMTVGFLIWGFTPDEEVDKDRKINGIGLGQNQGPNQRKDNRNPAGAKPPESQDSRNPPDIVRYSDNRDGTVTDKQTGLMWLKEEAYDVSLDEAKAAPGRITAGGYTDWRMPGMLELLSIVDTTLNKPPFNDILGVSDTEYFWSSENSSDRSWVLNAGGGTGDKRANDSRKSGGDKIYSLKLVRGNLNIPSPRFTDNGDGTVTDNFLKLIWQQKALTGLSLDEAQSSIEQMNKSQQSGWRLPTMPELAMLCDRSLSNPAVDKKHFPSIASDKYWTSSPLASGKGRQWFVDMTTGMTTYDEPQVKHSVLAVKQK